MSFIQTRAHLNAGPMTNEQISRLAPSVFAAGAHESRSSRYTYIPTSEVVDGMRANGFLPVFARQGKSRIEGKAAFTKHLIRFRQEGGVVSKAGDTFPEVILLNSHDGTSTYQLMAGLFRVQCMNGMYCSEATFGTLKVPHKGDVVSKVIEGSFEVLEDSKRGLAQAEGWAGITLPRDAQVALAESARVLRFGDGEGNVATAIKAEQLLTARRYDDQGGSLWLTHNRIQENAIKGGLTAMGRDANGQPRRVGSYELFDLTASYAPVKSLKFRVGIKNLMDRNPPTSNQIYSFLASYDPNYTDPRGRSFFGSISYSFK